MKLELETGEELIIEFFDKAKANMAVAQMCFDNGFMMRVQIAPIMQPFRQQLSLLQTKA